jgi:rare lipoprotein A
VALLAGGCGDGSDRVAARPVAAPASVDGGGYKVGQPYRVDGVRYVPREVEHYDETGVASWYGPEFHGLATANGERFDQQGLTAAHPTLPMPSLVRVTNLENGRSVVLRVNDRGPFARGRIIDVSRRSAQLLGFMRAGTAKVRVTLLGQQSRRLKQAILAGGGETRVAAAAPHIVIPGATAAVATAPSSSISDLEQHLRQIVGRESVRPTALYVQIGAFAEIARAERLRRTLHGLGPVGLSPVTVDGRRLHRVRLGPVSTVAAADQLLDRAVRAGYPGARIVVD